MDKKQRRVKSLEIQDKLVNLVAGINNKRDKSTYNKHEVALLSPPQLIAMYRDIWIAGKAVDIFAEDMTRKWRSYKGDKKEVNEFSASERKFNSRGAVYNAVKLARLYGGSAIIPVFRRDTNNSVSRPLKVEKVKKDEFVRFIVVDKTMLFPTGEITQDPFDENFYKPTYYSMIGNVNKIHHSRVFTFDGFDLPPQIKMNNGYWGDSVLQRMYQTINDADTTFHAVAQMMLEMVTDVIKIPNLSATLISGEETDAMIERFNLMKLLGSISQLKILDAEETWERHQIQLPGTNDIITQFLTMVSAAANIPVTRFIGTSPRGMNATGESDLEIHYENVHSKQESDLGPVVDKLDIIIQMNQFGSVIDGFGYEFLPLYMQDAKEAADTKKVTADERQIYSSLGVLPKSAIAKKLQDEGWDIERDHITKLEEYDKSLDLAAQDKAKLGPINNRVDNKNQPQNNKKQPEKK